MLVLSKLARTEMQRERVDLSALSQAIAAELRRRAPDRRVELVIKEGLVVEGDIRLLRVAIENLLENAWKFTGNTPLARIEVGATIEAGQKTHFVRDNGAGFDMAYANKLFGAFQRLHGANEFPGTGIGLATVQRVLHRHGGKAWAEGQVGQGATFYFVL
jgi:light-regulated signal transduction histidine kinase (bacteriophytochrome)